MDRIVLLAVIVVLGVLGFFFFQGKQAQVEYGQPILAEEPILALVDYRNLSESEANGIAVVDFNPTSSTFGEILQRFEIGSGVLSHHLYSNRDGSKLYTSALSGDRLYRVIVKEDRIEAVVPLDTGDCLIGEDLYFSEDDATFYLTCMGSDRVMVFDAQTDQPLSEIQAPAPDKPFIRYPHGISVDEGIDRMIVTETISGDSQTPGTTVTVIEFSSGEVLSTHELVKDIDVPSAPVEVMFLDDDPIAYITGMLDATIWAAIWDESTQAFEFNVVDDGAARGQSWPLEMALGPDGNLYVSFAQPGVVNVYNLDDPTSPRLIETLPTEAGAHHIEFSADGAYLFVQNNMLNLDGMNAGTISVLDRKSGEIVATINAFNEAGLKPESIMLLGQGGDR